MKEISVILLFLLVPAIASAGGLHHERWYQDQWCAANNGQAEVVFADRTRCDCVTATHAVEFDFGPKWAEAIGQALHYLPIDVWKVGPDDFEGDQPQ